MSVHPSLRRLFRLGGSAAVAAERLREPERQFERLQAGLERAGFDAADPLAPLLGGAFTGDTLAGTLDRLARAPGTAEPMAEAFARRKALSPTIGAGEPRQSRVFEPLANPRLARLLQTHAQPGAQATAPAVAAAARAEAAGRAIGAAQAAASLARRALAAGADSAWTEPVRAPQTAAANTAAATGAAWQAAGFDAARVATGAARPDSGPATAAAQEPAGVTQRLERLVERVESSVRGGARTGAARPALARAATGWPTGAAGEARPRAAEPLGAGAAEFDRGDQFPRAGRGTEARAEARFDPPEGGRIGGFRGLAALARNRGGDPAATGDGLRAAGSEAMPAAPTFPAAPGTPAERSAASGFPPAPDAAPEGRDGEALARELARLLRREAERHGIDLDGVGP